MSITKKFWTKKEEKWFSKEAGKMMKEYNQKRALAQETLNKWVAIIIVVIFIILWLLGAFS